MENELISYITVQGLMHLGKDENRVQCLEYAAKGTGQKQQGGEDKYEAAFAKGRLWVAIQITPATQKNRKGTWATQK